MSTGLFALILAVFALGLGFAIYHFVWREPEMATGLSPESFEDEALGESSLLNEFSQISRYLEDLENALKQSGALDEESRGFFEERRRRLGRLELRFASFTLRDEDPEIRKVMQSVLEELESFQLRFIRN